MTALTHSFFFPGFRFSFTSFGFFGFGENTNSGHGAR